MKYELYVDDIHNVVFQCEKINKIAFQYTCNQHDCKVEDIIKCWKQHVIKQLEKDCLIQNFVKWKYLIKKFY